MNLEQLHEVERLLKESQTLQNQAMMIQNRAVSLLAGITGVLSPAKSARPVVATPGQETGPFYVYDTRRHQFLMSHPVSAPWTHDLAKARKIGTRKTAETAIASRYGEATMRVLTAAEALAAASRAVPAAKAPIASKFVIINPYGRFHRDFQGSHFYLDYKAVWADTVDQAGRFTSERVNGIGLNRFTCGFNWCWQHNMAVSCLFDIVPVEKAGQALTKVRVFTPVYDDIFVDLAFAHPLSAYDAKVIEARVQFAVWELKQRRGRKIANLRDWRWVDEAGVEHRVVVE